MSRWRHWESEAERVFKEDTRDKKRIAHSANKRPHGGAMRTALDLLQGKEKRQYSKPGGLKIMFHIPDTYAELKEMSEEQQKAILKYLFEDVFVADPKSKVVLCNKWGMQTGALHKKAQGLGVIPKPEPKPKKEKKALVSVIEVKEEQEVQEVQETVKTNDDVVIVGTAVMEAIERLEARQISIEALLQQTIAYIEVIARAGMTANSGVISVQKSEADISAEFMASVLKNMQR